MIAVELGMAAIIVVLGFGGYLIWRSSQKPTNVKLDHELAKRAYEDAAEEFRKATVALKREETLLRHLARDMASAQLLSDGGPLLTAEEEHDAFVDAELNRRRDVIDDVAIRGDFT